MQHSMVNLSQVKENDWRLDGEYWLPEYLEFEKIADKKGYPRLKDLNIERFASGENLIQTENGIPFIRTQNIRDVILTDEGLSFTDSDKFDKLQEGDILFTRVGAGIGDSSIVTKNYINSAYSDNTLCIRIKDDKINNYFLGLYFATQKSRNYIARFFNGTAQPIVSKTTLNQLPIPLLSIQFQTAIANLVQRAFELQQSSQTLYKEAETLLLEELGLLNWKPKHQLWCVKSYSDTVQANRMDAEYFQPMYEEVLRRIKEYKWGFAELGQIGKFTSGSFVSDEFYSEHGTPYIRIKELSFKGSINKEQIIYLNKNFIRKNETQVFEGDFVMATIGNTIGKVNLIDKTLCGAIPSNNTSKYELKNKEDSFYFQTLLQSLIVQKQIEREYTQTAQPKISDSALSKIIIPILPLQTQQQISQKVVQSKENDKQSKSLLETAKKAVEMAIEESEEVAMGFIKKNIC